MFAPIKLPGYANMSDTSGALNEPSSLIGTEGGQPGYSENPRAASSFCHRGRMRILHCCPWLTGGGAERQLTYLVNYWAEGDHEVHLAYLAGSPIPDELQRPGIILHPLSHYNNHDPLLLPRLIRLIRSIRPDVVHTWLLQMDVFAGLAAYLTGTPWLLREPISAGWWSEGVKTKLRRWVGSKADAVVSNSAGGDAYWAQYVPVSRRFVISNAVPVDIAVQIPPARPEDLGLPDRRPIIMFAGRIVAAKNLEVLARALKLVLAEMPGVAVMFGAGPLRTSLKELITDLGLVDRVFLPGALPTIWAALKSADLFVSISKIEGRPNAVLEAMACHCPLVVSDIPAHREFLDEDTALLVERYDDPNCVAATILKALGDREGAVRRGDAAARRVSGWSIPAIAKEYENVYATILQRRKSQHGRISRENDGSSPR